MWVYVRGGTGPPLIVSEFSIDHSSFRQEYATSIFDQIFARVEEMRNQTIPSEPLRKAIDYTLNQRKALYRYLEDGRLKPDNNTAEDALRPVAVSGKNWLFVGSERGGRAAALYMSLVQSCKACKINSWEYFDDMFRRIMTHPVSRLRELLPDQWKPLPRDARGMILPDKQWQSQTCRRFLTAAGGSGKRCFRFFSLFFYSFFKEL